MSSESARAPSAIPVWRSVLLFVLSLLPAGVAVLPLTMGAAWYLSAEENAPFLDEWRVLEMLTAFVVGIAPFLAAAVALVSVRAAGRGWATALKVAECWAFGLGGFAFVAAMLFGGGF